jgi:hypothetical protein
MLDSLAGGAADPSARDTCHPQPVRRGCDKISSYRVIVSRHDAQPPPICQKEAQQKTADSHIGG